MSGDQPTFAVSAAIVPALLDEIAVWQARSLGQRALGDAARKEDMAAVAAEATRLQRVYDDVVARLYGLTDKVLAAGVTTGAAAKSTALDSCVADDTESKQALAVARNAQLPATERYVALGIVAKQTRLKRYSDAALQAEYKTLYDTVTDKLPDLNEVAKALHKILEMWRKTYGQDVKFSDFIHKLSIHVNRLIALRAAYQRQPNVADRDEYEKLCDIVIANMSTMSWPPGEIQGYGEATTKELRRLRDDLGVV